MQSRATKPKESFMVDVRIEHDGPCTFAHLSGEMTGDETSEAAEALREFAGGPSARLAVVLSSLKLIDSTGLAVLINLVNRARLSGGRVVLVAPSAFVASVFNVTRLDTWFDMCADLAEARKQLGAS
jgi:anti-sigma B factor antagonist